MDETGGWLHGITRKSNQVALIHENPQKVVLNILLKHNSCKMNDTQNDKYE